MNYGRMKEVVRVLLGETDSSNSYWSDTEIEAMINDSQQPVASETRGLLTYRDYTTADGTYRYALQSDYLMIKAIHFYKTTDTFVVLEYKDLADYAEYTGGNTTLKATHPTIFKVEIGAVDNNPAAPGDIWVYPIPDSIKTMRVYYYQKPTDMSGATDISEIPELGHWAICYHTAAMLHLKQANELAFRKFIGLYERELIKIKQYYNQLQRVRPYYTKDVMGYGESDL